MSDSDHEKSWLEKLSMTLAGEPTSRSELLHLLRSAEQRELLDGEALGIIEGALTVSEMQVREVMVPRSQVVFVRLDENPEEFLPTVIGSGHSRFPVLGEGQDEIVGILLAKDLLALAIKDRTQKFNLRDRLRPCTAVPESKRLDVLLQEFRATRNHLAVVYDEYGGVCGIVTIEDVLEQIVGDIEDEFDFEEEGFIHQLESGEYTIKALTPIDDFNEHFGAKLSDDEFDTIGGLVTNAFGHLPQRDEQVNIDQFHFKVLNADGRRVHLMEMQIVE
ncbi:MAG TPA: magnesium/cobalt efflux protein [Gammaproteobacteria bacterium]|nr:magnesium/cobalt efflux protein [Gammaproteobacteria bacterium]|tara:strand:- start:141 stop:968 length:828 start_codon:yes stop_codon:yes gene_type:complete